MFTKQDMQQMEAKGIGLPQVNAQIAYFRAGFPFLSIAGPAVAGDGIRRFSAQEAARYAEEYDRRVSGLSAVKFVPASGAATRMFKDLYAFLNEGKESAAVREVLENLDRFAFCGELEKLGVKRGGEPRKTISAIVGDEGLGYGKLPKGLLLFHAYPEGSRTALEEHLAEGAMYARSGDGTVHIHFTVSPEHQAGFEALVGRVLPDYEAKFGVRYAVSYSQQKPMTDTIAVDMNDEPFREKDGSLLFRPGGHGALLENLNDISADVIFIKNIDNVVPDHLKGDTVTYKKVLAAVLLELQAECFSLLEALENEADEAAVGRAADFVRRELGYRPAPDFDAKPVGERRELLRDVLDRPVRVCGMVKNEGEPGGGPFWVRDEDGSLSLQIAESSQIAPEQKELMRTATHFNPVDLVCGVRDRKGTKYDLRKYCDPQTGFISVKSKDGRELKAQELPGLWNGAMARWNTVFVEVPIATFNPVKSVNDLLRPQHQGA